MVQHIGLKWASDYEVKQVPTLIFKVLNGVKQFRTQLFLCIDLQF